MNILEVIKQCDDLKPNQYAEADKVRWVKNIEKQIEIEIINTHEPIENVHSEKELCDELIVPIPYCDLYIKYLMAQIDFANGEMGRYNNSAIMFNIAYQGYADYYNRTHMPLVNGKFDV